MADVYIIVAGEDKEFARPLKEALSTRWSVWCDDDIVGSYPKAIEEEMPKAGCVVYINSTIGRGKINIIDELGIAGRHGRTIITIRLDDTDAPYPFGRHSSVEMENWSGDESDRQYKLLLHKISQAVPPREKPRRPLSVFEGRMKLPSIFMSVSSHETQLAPEEAVSLTRVFGARTVLVSAYDWAPKNIATKRVLKTRNSSLNALHKSGALILIDSGNYEATRKKDEHWTREDYAKVLDSVPHDIACAFDILSVPTDPKRHLKVLIAGFTRDVTLTSAPIVPIVHSRRLKTGKYDLDQLPWLLCELSKKLHPLMIAIPERELGEGLIERVRAMQRLRQALDALPFYQPVHLLGTGNPWSIAALAAAGADSFDGLEWCRVVADRDEDRLNHFQHYDLFATQNADSRVTTKLAVEKGAPFAWRAALHNLDYYAEFTSRLQSLAAKDQLETLVTALLRKSRALQLAEQVPGLFK